MKIIVSLQGFGDPVNFHPRVHVLAAYATV